MIDFIFINSVLARFEGKGYTRGYVPCSGGTYYGGSEPEKGEPLDQSGVTIATGFDLGQQDMNRLIEMFIPADIRLILAPYLTLKRLAAVKKLKEAPLTVTADQVKVIDEAVHKHYINDTAAKFGWELFNAAPKEVQAVAVSLCYQFGTPSRAASPGLKLAWEAMRAGKYQDAALYLTTLKGWSVAHQKYLARRKQEAALLNQIV